MSEAAGDADDVPERTGEAAALTVREMLAMPAFAPARLVAGRGGLDNPIEWAHIVDIPDAAFDWGRPRVLVLTAGYGLGDEQQQRRLVATLAERHFAGLVVSLGYAVDDVPSALRDAADAYHLPVIATPPDVLFISLTEAIFAQLVNRQYGLMQRSAEVRQQLTDVVLRGGGLDGAAASLATLLRRSVTIEDPSFRVLATASRGPVDEARERSVAAGRASPEVAAHLVESGLYRQLTEQMTPIRVPPIPKHGMTMERIVAPIIVDRALEGYIWIIAGEHALTDLDELALSHGATVAALIMLKERAVRSAVDSLRGDLVHQLLADQADMEELLVRADEVGFRLERPHQALFVQPTEPASVDSGATLTERVAGWLAAEEPSGLAARRPDGIVVIVESEQPEHGERLAQRMHAELTGDTVLFVGVGPVAKTARDAGPLRASYLDAREAVEIAGGLGAAGGVQAAWTLGLVRWLHRLPEEALASNPYVEVIARLHTDATPRGTDLAATLAAYLDHGGSTAETARALHVHRNTLLHRLDRLEQQLDVDLRDPRVRLELHAALQGYRLRGH